MNKTGYDAIYTRQSVDKVDSISVESQLEFCIKEAQEDRLKIYSDKGYSGKNTERPAFQEMLQDIERGMIQRVIVYRLDRISRSVLDFSNLIVFFQKYQVEFVSTMEKFDTSTPVGKAMLMIVMVFAQLERETIQKRISDAYYSRSRRGFYMGGTVPYGFRLKETVIDGVHTKMYEAEEKEAELVKLIYSIYKKPQNSLGDVVKELDAMGIRRRDGKSFSRYRIRDIVINPSYVKADYEIYLFFKKNGAVIVNEPEEFIGNNAVYLYSCEGEKRKTVSFEGHMLVLAPHTGVVDSQTWLSCRKKCMNNTQVLKPVKAKQTWLAGKIKCKYCGYALVAKSYKRKNKSPKRYYFCSNKSSDCDFHSLDVDKVEMLVLKEIKEKLEMFPVLEEPMYEAYDSITIKLKETISNIDQEIELLVEKLPTANETLMHYANSHISKLDKRKQELLRQLKLKENTIKAKRGHIEQYISKWDMLSISDKITVVDCLIESIQANEAEIEINWKI